MRSKKEIEQLLEKISSGKTVDFKTPSFKYADPEIFLLSEDGFLRIMKSDLSKDCYREKMTYNELQTGKVRKFLRSYFTAPYYVSGTTIYFFDPVAYAEIRSFGSLRHLIDVLGKL